MPTSREILNKPNPAITDAWDGRSFGNTESSKDIYDDVVFTAEHPYTIQEWTDFNWDAIELAYGDTLDQAPATFKAVNTPTITPTTIAEEKGIDKLGEAWTCNIVRAPLKAAAAVVRPRATVAGKSTTDPSLSSFAVKWKHPAHQKTELDPDWVIFDRTLKKTYREEAAKATEKYLVYAIGDSKMRQKWQSSWLHHSLAGGYVDPSPAVPISGKPIQKTHTVTQERLKPLNQVATYCRFAQTRYSFILTQQELVALRIRRIDQRLLGDSVADPGKFHAAIEYKSVPWNASGPGKLTVNLAIWALGCMGMNEFHREMEGQNHTPLDSMVRLTKWKHDTAKKLYRNVISGREISEADWKKMGAKTTVANLDGAPNAPGDSKSSSFTQASGVGSITQGMKKASINPSSSQGNTTTNTAKKTPSPPPTRPSSSSGVQKAAPPAPPKYVIEGTTKPSYELKSSKDSVYFMKDSKTAVKVKKDAKGKYYFTVPDPKDKKKVQTVYLKQV